MANVDVVADRIAPTGGSNYKGHKIGVIYDAGKVASGDTITVTNAGKIIHAEIIDEATQDKDIPKWDKNVITLNGANTGKVSGFIIYV